MRVVLSAALVAVVVLLPVAAGDHALHEPLLTLVLTGDPHPAGDGLLVLERAAHGAASSATMSDCATWALVDPSAVPGSLGGMYVGFSFLFEDLVDTSKVVVQIGKLALAGFVPAATLTVPASSNPVTGRLFLDSVSLDAGAILAVRLCILTASGAPAGAILAAAGSSLLWMPDVPLPTFASGSEPMAVPTPELSTLVLTTAGLLAMGAVALRRRR